MAELHRWADHSIKNIHLHSNIFCSEVGSAFSVSPIERRFLLCQVSERGPSAWFATTLKSLPEPILCHEIGRVFAFNFEKTRRKAWEAQCFNCTCYAVAIDGELFPVVLGLFTMAVLVCKKSCEIFH